jgi:hypothetical protein
MGRGSSPEVGQEFSALHIVKTGFEPHPAPYPMGPWAFSPGEKRPVCEADHSGSTSV